MNHSTTYQFLLTLCKDSSCPARVRKSCGHCHPLTHITGAPPELIFASLNFRWGGARIARGVRKMGRQKHEDHAKQLKLFKVPRRKITHGGSLAVKKRRSKRPLNLKLSHHLTMKSYQAVGPRSLFRHKKMILSLIKKNSIRFKVKVFEYAIQGNHIHMLVKAESRIGLQNFFRFVAGQAESVTNVDKPQKKE